MVELVGVMATIMRDWSVELDVRDFLPPSPPSEKQGGGADRAFEDMMRAMEEAGKRTLYAQAQDRAWTILEQELGGLVTLQCVGRKVPLRFCRRGGGEVFGD